MTAVQLHQMEYLDRARKYTEDRYGADVDEMTADVLNRWESVLGRLAEDPMLMSRELDWVAKLELLEGYRTRDQLGWGHHRAVLVDPASIPTCSLRNVRPVQPAGGQGPDSPHRVDDEVTRAIEQETPGRSPEPTSAVAACRNIRTPWPPRRGTR